MKKRWNPFVSKSATLWTGIQWGVWGYLAYFGIPLGIIYTSPWLHLPMPAFNFIAYVLPVFIAFALATTMGRKYYEGCLAKTVLRPRPSKWKSGFAALLFIFGIFNPLLLTSAYANLAAIGIFLAIFLVLSTFFHQYRLSRWRKAPLSIAFFDRVFGLRHQMNEDRRFVYSFIQDFQAAAAHFIEPAKKIKLSNDVKIAVPPYCPMLELNKTSSWIITMGVMSSYLNLRLYARQQHAYKITQMYPSRALANFVKDDDAFTIRAGIILWKCDLMDEKYVDMVRRYRKKNGDIATLSALSLILLHYFQFDSPTPNVGDLFHDAGRNMPDHLKTLRHLEAITTAPLDEVGYSLRLIPKVPTTRRDDTFFMQLISPRTSDLPLYLTPAELHATVSVFTQPDIHRLFQHYLGDEQQALAQAGNSMGILCHNDGTSVTYKSLWLQWLRFIRQHRNPNQDPIDTDLHILTELRQLCPLPLSRLTDQHLLVAPTQQGLEFRKRINAIFNFQRSAFLNYRIMTMADFGGARALAELINLINPGSTDDLLDQVLRGSACLTEEVWQRVLTEHANVPQANPGNQPEQRQNGTANAHNTTSHKSTTQSARRLNRALGARLGYDEQAEIAQIQRFETWLSDQRMDGARITAAQAELARHVKILLSNETCPAVLRKQLCTEATDEDSEQEEKVEPIAANAPVDRRLNQPDNPRAMLIALRRLCVENALVNDWDARTEKGQPRYHEQLCKIVNTLRDLTHRLLKTWNLHPNARTKTRPEVLSQLLKLTGQLQDQHETRAALRFVTYIKSEHYGKTKESPMGITMRRFVALCLLASTKPSKRKGGLSEADCLKTLRTCFYLVIRGYNEDAGDNKRDHGGPDRPACAGGGYNKISQEMSTAIKGVERHISSGKRARSGTGRHGAAEDNAIPDMSRTAISAALGPWAQDNMPTSAEIDSTRDANAPARYQLAQVLATTVLTADNPISHHMLQNSHRSLVGLQAVLLNTLLHPEFDLAGIYATAAAATSMTRDLDEVNNVTMAVICEGFKCMWARCQEQRYYAPFRDERGIKSFIETVLTLVLFVVDTREEEAEEVKAMPSAVPAAALEHPTPTPAVAPLAGEVKEQKATEPPFSPLVLCHSNHL